MKREIKAFHNYFNPIDQYMTIEEQLRTNAIQKPTKIALIGKNTEVTYCQLWDYCLMTAQKLQKEFGIRKGDRVILAAAGSS